MNKTIITPIDTIFSAKTPAVVSIVLFAVLVTALFSACYEPSPLYGTWSDNDGNSITFIVDGTFNAKIKVEDKVTNVENNVSEMKKDIKEIKDKPGKRMDAIWGYIISTIAGAIVTFILVKVGLK